VLAARYFENFEKFARYFENFEKFRKNHLLAMADKENVSSQILSPAPSSLPRLRVRNEIRDPGVRETG